MPKPEVGLSCPKSSLSWRVGTRARRGRPGELTATCPSCGQGLTFRQSGNGLELVPPVNSDPASRHQVLRRSTSVGLRG